VDQKLITYRVMFLCHTCLFFRPLGSDIGLTERASAKLQRGASRID
jgi:hypothetical protein